MATLQGTKIKDTYPGLLKSGDNAALGAVEKEITDGTGVSSTLKLGTTSASFVGTLDLSGATVIGGGSSGSSGTSGTSGTSGVDGLSGVTSIIAGTGITVDQATGDVTVTASGGGGGGVELAEGQNITLGFSTLQYSIPWILSGYGQQAALSMIANSIQLIPFYAKPGESMSEFYVRVQTGTAGATMNIGLYKGYVDTSSGSKQLYPEYVATIASGVSIASGGKKLVTGLNILFPTDAVGGLYWIGFISDTSGPLLTKWSNWVAAERVIFSDIYRSNGCYKGTGSSALPTGQIDLSTGTAGSTDLCVDFAWKYKA